MAKIRIGLRRTQSLRKNRKLLPESKKGVWNSLELAKIATALLVPLSIGGIGLWINYDIRKTQDRRDREALVAQKEKIIWDEIAALTDLQEAYKKRSKDATNLLQILKDTDRQNENVGSVTRLRRELFMDRELTYHNIVSPLESVRFRARICLNSLVELEKRTPKLPEKSCDHELSDWRQCAYAVVLGLFVAAKNPEASDRAMMNSTGEPTESMDDRCPKAEPLFRF